MAEHLLKCGANIDAAYNISEWEDDYTQLRHIVKNGGKETIKWLLSKGANVNGEGKDGMTSLRVALKEKEFQIAEHLLRCGANVDAVYSLDTEEGYIPLHLAGESSHLDVIELLLKFGVKVDSTIKHAAKYGGQKIVEFFLKLGAGVNSTDQYGQTVFHSASKNGRIEIVTALLEHGSDIPIMSKQNYTAFDYAMYPYEGFHINYFHRNDHVHVKVLKILKRHMVKIKAANLYAVNKDILSIPSPAFGSYNDELSDFQNEREKEIASMQNKLITDNITFYDVLARSVRQVTMYATNESIVEAFGSDNYKIKFPIYVSMINSNFRKGEKEKEFMEKSDKIFDFLFNNNFPLLPREKILSYLNYEDLM